ncbi:BRICHOS domain-containing protein 5 isoform X1 [Maylandia zebra]|uniref:BRICHOS domain-containing protein 5 isoform X1 n=1 Tax=Maylandia zebra TaxID=106582 RepID=UPI00403D39B6
MVRCWKRSENCLEEEECTDGGPEESPLFHFPHKAFWVSLSACLLLAILALGLTGHFGRSQPHTQPLQTVRFTVSDQTGALINQSAVVDQQNDLVTFSVTSSLNQTSTVLFDIKHSLICYKPVSQESCFLRKMEQSDYKNVNSVLHESARKAQANRGWSTSASTSASPATSACPCASTTFQSDSAFSLDPPGKRSGKQSCPFFFFLAPSSRTKASFDCFLCAIQPPVNHFLPSEKELSWRRAVTVIAKSPSSLSSCIIPSLVARFRD